MNCKMRNLSNDLFFPRQHSCLGKKMSPLKFAESHNKRKHFLKVINKSIHLSYTNCPTGPKGCAGKHYSNIYNESSWFYVPHLRKFFSLFLIFNQFLGQLLDLMLLMHPISSMHFTHYIFIFLKEILLLGHECFTFSLPNFLDTITQTNQKSFLKKILNVPMISHYFPYIIFEPILSMNQKSWFLSQIFCYFPA